MKRHPLDLFSLLAGLTFVAVAVLYLLDSAGQLSVNGRLVIPLLLVALGVSGLASAIHRMAYGQRSDSASTTASAPAPAPVREPVRTPSAGAGPAPADARPGSRYDELSTDLESLGLLDEPEAPGETGDRP